MALVHEFENSGNWLFKGELVAGFYGCRRDFYYVSGQPASYSF